MRTEFAMTSAAKLADAVRLLSELGCEARRSPDRRGHRLVVDHDSEIAKEVRRLVEMADPGAGQATLVDSRRVPFRRQSDGSTPPESAASTTR
jgi:hypothetical protein